MKSAFKKIAIACQGGGSHCAYTSGVLAALMRKTEVVEGKLIIDGLYQLVGMSGTSGGAISAYLAWVDLLRMRNEGYRRPATFAVERFWEGMKAQPFQWPPMFPSPDLFSNWLQLALGQLDGILPMVSPSPNAITALAQEQLRDAIDTAAALSAAEKKRRGRPLAREQLKAATPQDLPVLLIGAANIDDSDFAPFISTPRRWPMTEQLLASAALPEFYPAVTVEAELSSAAQLKRDAVDGKQRGGASSASAAPRYWDGLLSQNPPLGDFLSVSFDQRAEEIWIVRINPALQVGEEASAGRRPEMLPGEMRDRRNELAGNLSLEQEKRFIRKINDLVRKHRALEKTHQTVQVWGIALDGPWDLPDSDENSDGDWLTRPADLPMPRQLQDLDATSKLKRFPPFIEALEAHGRACCAKFLSLRRETVSA